MVNVTKLDVRCESCKSIVKPDGPKYKSHLGLLGALLFGALGFATGSVIGIATAGFGIAATIPLSIMGLAVGYIGGSYIARLHDGVTCPGCGGRFGSFIPGR